MVRKKGYTPDRGDIVWLEFNPQAGREQAGRRPALVLSPKAYNQATSLALMCPIISKVKGYPFETPVPDGLKVSGVVLADHLKSLDWRARNGTFADKAPEGVVADVRLKLHTLI
jgi:mRNA interferase MazF